MNGRGDVIIIGSPYYNSYNGRIDVYRDTGSDWISVKYYNGPRSNSHYGNSVDINDDGNIIAVGAYGDITNSNDYGAVYIYKWNNGTDFSSGNYVYLGSRINGNTSNQNFGEAVSLNGYGTRIATNYKNYSGSYKGSLQMWEIAELTFKTNYITLGDDISGNDASFNNINLLGDICGNDVSFNNVELGNIKIKGDISGNDVSFNNMDVNAIESNNWYIKSNGDVSANDVSFNNTYCLRVFFLWGRCKF